MPIRIFICDSCESSKKVLNPKEDCLECECGGQMSFGPPKLADPICLEKLDPYRNKQIMKGQDKIMKERAKKHFVENELEGLIEHWGEGHAKSMKWLRKDGKKKNYDDYT